MIITRDKIVETAETIGAIKTAKVGEDSKKDEDGEYLNNFTQVPYILYPITFWKKSVLALLDSSNEVNTIHSTFA